MFTRNRVIDVGCEQNNLDRLTYMFRKTYMCIHTRALFITLQLKLFSQLKTTVHRFQNVISLLDATTNQCIYIICIYVRPSEPQLKLDTVGTAEKRSPETSDSPSAAMDALWNPAYPQTVCCWFSVTGDWSELATSSDTVQIMDLYVCR